MFAGRDYEELHGTGGRAAPPCMDEFLYQPSGSETITGSPLLIIQVTRLRCGGFIFALWSNHCMSDAIGTLQFMKALAEMARGASRPSIPPVRNREILRPRPNPIVKYTHHAFDHTFDVYTQQRNEKEEMQCLSLLFGPEEISALKRKVGGKYCSTFEVLSACLWRARSKALNIPAEQDAKFIFPINIRSRLQPPLPTGYYGNALSLSCALARTRDLTERPLSFAVNLISDAKKIVDDGYVRSEIDMMELRGHPSPTMVGSLNMSDTTKSDFAGVDFGWGKSEYGGPAVGAIPGISCLISVHNTTSGIERINVPICLPTTAIQTFQQELSCQEFTDVVGSPYYVAPEVLCKRYGPEADVWTAGVILYILLSGVPPFWAETQQGIFDVVLRGHIDFDSEPWSSISESAKDLIRKMLTSNPAQRLTAHGVLCHSWICKDGVAPDQALDPAVLSRLKQFSVMNKLKKMALMIIAESLSEEEIAGLREMMLILSFNEVFERVEVDRIFSAIKSNYSAWVSGFVPPVVGVDEPSVVNEFSTKMLNMKPEIALTVAKIIFEIDMRSILCDVKTPCHIIQTRKDMVVPLSVSYYMQRNIQCTYST